MKKDKANLRDAKLSGADLSFANLNNADQRIGAGTGGMDTVIRVLHRRS